MIAWVRYLAARHKLTASADDATADGDENRALSIIQARLLQLGEGGRQLWQRRESYSGIKAAGRSAIDGTKPKLDFWRADYGRRIGWRLGIGGGDFAPHQFVTPFVTPTRIKGRLFFLSAL